MTNKIGVLELPYLAGIPSPSRSGNEVKLQGYFTTRDELSQLEEMFRKAPGGTVVNTIVGGIQTGFDLTEGAVLTQWCEFDASHIIDGWYLLRSLNSTFEQYDSYYPFDITLFFLGTNYDIQLGYKCFFLEELTNDWDL